MRHAGRGTHQGSGRNPRRHGHGTAWTRDRHLREVGRWPALYPCLFDRRARRGRSLFRLPGSSIRRVIGPPETGRDSGLSGGRWPWLRRFYHNRNCATRGDRRWPCPWVVSPRMRRGAKPMGGADGSRRRPARRAGGFSRRWQPWPCRRSWPARRRRPPRRSPLASATVIAAGGVFLVNGWVLTAADLDVLGLDAG